MPDAAQSQSIQSLCEQGQAALLTTDYLAAERYLVAAENLAWDAKDYDAITRLYMPLQEARRQRRQRCSDGVFATISKRSINETIDPAAVAKENPLGQLIVAGFGTITPVTELRTIADQQQLYLDLPLAASYVVGGETVILFVPLPDVTLPDAEKIDSIDALLRKAPPHSVIVPLDAIAPDRPLGDSGTFGYLMNLWETLHAPFLAMADGATDPHQKLALYRQTIRVDYACEFAHQRLSDTARLLSRRK